MQLWKFLKGFKNYWKIQTYREWHGEEFETNFSSIFFSLQFFILQGIQTTLPSAICCCFIFINNICSLLIQYVCLFFFFWNKIIKIIKICLTVKSNAMQCKNAIPKRNTQHTINTQSNDIHLISISMFLKNLTALAPYDYESLLLHTQQQPFNLNHMCSKIPKREWMTSVDICFGFYGDYMEIEIIAGFLTLLLLFFV